MGTGLYDGFEGYRSATPDERREAVRSWMVVLDTNVLLSLYNFHGSALDDFMNVFGALEDRLFVPHQVMDEFWRNRRTALKQNQGKHQERDHVQESFDKIESALRRWHQRVVDRAGLPPADVLKELREGRDAVLAHMDEKNAAAAITQPDTPTYDDPVLQRLQPLLDGRVGPPPADFKALLAEAKARVASRTPPGYMDAGKGDARSGGDYLVWRQAMDEATRRKVPVLLVTQDQKDDWWADAGTGAMRARPELVAELKAVAGQPLLMMRAHDLLAHADALGVTVSQTTVDAAEEAADEDTLTGVAVLYQQFWELFEDPARKRWWIGPAAKPPTKHWWSMYAGGGGNTWSVNYTRFGCRVELYLSNADPEVNLRHLRLLESRRDEIQAAYGEKERIVYSELPNRLACRVDVRIEDGRKVANTELWQETADWMVDRMERLRAAVEAVGGVPRV